MPRALSRTAQGAPQSGSAASSGRHVWIAEDEGQIALIVDGVVQSVLVDERPFGLGYWPLMLPDAAPHRALILGMAGGTIAHLLRRRFGPIEIVGVEHDPEIIHLARTAFGVDDSAFQVVEGDAFEFVAAALGPYDYVAVDLFVDGRIPGRIFTRPFLRQVRRLLSPGGLAAINFFRDGWTPSRLERIASVFPRVTTIESRENVVALCRAR